MSPPREIELKLDVPVHNLARLTASSLLKRARKAAAKPVHRRLSVSWILILSHVTGKKHPKLPRFSRLFKGRNRLGASTTFRFLDFNFVTRDRQKAPEIAPLFNAFQRAGPRPENSFLYLLGHIDLASIRASSAP